MGIASTQHHSRFPSSIVCSSSTTLSAFPPPFFFSFLSFVVRIKKGKKKNWRTSPFHIEYYPTLLFHSTLVLVVPVDNDEVSLQWPASSHLLARTCPSGGWAALFVWDLMDPMRFGGCIVLFISANYNGIWAETNCLYVVNWSTGGSFDSSFWLFSFADIREWAQIIIRWAIMAQNPASDVEKKVKTGPKPS